MSIKWMEEYLGEDYLGYEQKEEEILVSSERVIPAWDSLLRGGGTIGGIPHYVYD